MERSLLFLFDGANRYMQDLKCLDLCSILERPIFVSKYFCAFISSGDLMELLFVLFQVTPL
jgi:hypothetical protein